VEPTSGLLDAAHEKAGVRWSTGAGVRAGLLPRNYGDPAAEYAAARNAAVIVDRRDRSLFRVHGRDPVGMVHNLVTNDVAGASLQSSVYAVLLTPKGRMVADLRIVRRETDLLLECDAAAGATLLDTWKRSVPPLFARIDYVGPDRTDEGERRVVLGVYGPLAAGTLSAVLTEALPSDAPEMTVHRGRFGEDEVLALVTHDNAATGFDVIAPASVAADLWDAIVNAGARPMGHSTLDVLRIEASRPRWGTELDAEVIPLEAGLLERAISTKKGCYTGQEVIIRILHRGHVNRHLRGMLLGDVPAPAPGTTMHREAEPKALGRVTSAAWSPEHGQTIALGYVRREVEPPATLRLGSPDGPAVRIVTLPFEAAP
jgi:folate-binding protein YgfZ